MMMTRNIGLARLALGGLFAATMIGGGLLLTAAGGPAAPPAAPAAPAAVKTRAVIVLADKAEQDAEHIVNELMARLDIDGIVRTALASARSGLSVQCAAAGAPVAKDADWNSLATCGPKMRETIRTSLQSARQTISTVRGLTDSQRAAALSGLDEALAEVESDPDLGGPAK